MIVTIAQPWLWLLQGAATLPDTIITKQVTADPGLFTKVTGVASGLVSIVLLVLTVFLVPAAWNFRKVYAKANELLKRVYGDVEPITRHVGSITDNLDYISTALRTDVAQVSRTIASANERLRQALDVTERRVREFNALLAVVQEEAEETFVSTAATVRGVRIGAATLGAELGEGSADVNGEGTLDPEEMDDGDDDRLTPDAGTRPRRGPRTARGRST